MAVFTRSRRAFFAGVALLTFASLGLRLFRLANQSFWIDEVSSILAAQSPLNNIYERSALASNSLPTYFVLLKTFIGTTADDLEFRARLLSVIAGVLSIPLFVAVMYLWRRQRGTALLAGTLLTVNPLHLWYSQEVRGYAVTLLFGLLTLLCFELAREKRRAGWWVLYVLFGIIAITAHKTALIFPVACGLWHAWDVFKQRGQLKNLLIHAPIALAAIVAMTLKSYPPVEGYGRNTTGLEVGYTFLTFLGGYSFGPSLTDIQSFGPWTA
ncbi:MAG TPA: glycosyltransferase family 39 protein, partial [Verrucomicrobiae bacterium]|nr:glycosyltransferase family 39 protein [Verrucomicrobiae bacterium]